MARAHSPQRCEHHPSRPVCGGWLGEGTTERWLLGLYGNLFQRFFSLTPPFFRNPVNHDGFPHPLLVTVPSTCSFLTTHSLQPTLSLPCGYAKGRAEKGMRTREEEADGKAQTAAETKPHQFQLKADDPPT